MTPRERPQPDRALAKDDVVERPDVERGSERVLGLRPEREDLALAELVGQRLARHREVAVDLVDDVVLGERGVIDHEVDRLVAAPAERVDPGVDDEPARPPRVERQDPNRSRSPE